MGSRPAELALGERPPWRRDERAGAVVGFGPVPRATTSPARRRSARRCRVSARPPRSRRPRALARHRRRRCGGSGPRSVYCRVTWLAARQQVRDLHGRLGRVGLASRMNRSKYVPVAPSARNQLVGRCGDADAVVAGGEHAALSRHVHRPLDQDRHAVVETIFAETSVFFSGARSWPPTKRLVVDVDGAPAARGHGVALRQRTATGRREADRHLRRIGVRVLQQVVQVERSGRSRLPEIPGGGGRSLDVRRGCRSRPVPRMVRSTTTDGRSRRGGERGAPRGRPSSRG